MDMDKSALPRTVDEYIAGFTGDTRKKLEALRAAIRAAAPGAQETISYHMPAYMQGGPLVYFAAFKTHIGLFPTGEGVEAFRAELTGYKTSKGTVQFPLDEPLPLDLVDRMVRHRVGENLKK
jgi:uncharacterized protein YdhG (YjbR/CyaY superfamily)